MMDDSTSPAVMRMVDVGFDAASSLLTRYGLMLQRVERDQVIPGSFWGECEAGIIGNNVYARDDTPVHSLLHEAGHLIVLPAERRAAVHTDATDSIDEENAVCVLQSLLADEIPGYRRDQLFADMDAWGYTFRLGSSRAYVEQDAEDAWAWLQTARLVDSQRKLLLP